MINWVRATADCGLAAEGVHYEEFLAPQPGKPFEVKLACPTKSSKSAKHESLLEAMERSGVMHRICAVAALCGNVKRG